MSHEIEPCPVCGMKAHVEYIHKLEREVEEWKNRAIAAEGDLAWEQTENPNFRTLRRSSVNVFSLERYIGFKAREADRELLNPSQPEIGLYILEGIESIIARRIRRSTTNTKGE